MTDSISVGDVFSFAYPSPNRIGVFTRLRRRRVVIESIRDTVANPVERWAMELQPDLRRGRFLITGHDLDLHETRSFYLSSARSIKELSIPLFQLCIYHPLKPRIPLRPIGPYWTNSVADAKEIRDVIRLYNERMRFSRKLSVLGLFPVRTGGRCRAPRQSA